MNQPLAADAASEMTAPSIGPKIQVEARGLIGPSPGSMSLITVTRICDALANRHTESAGVAIAGMRE